jgi:hypothetical protein
MSIFQKSVVNKYLNTLDSEVLSAKYQLFRKHFTPDKIENIKIAKEEQYQEGFLRELFVDCLGYTINPNPGYNLTTEYKNLTNSKKASAAIVIDGIAQAVVELKSTQTSDLEKIKTQAFNYKNNQPECKFVITSNFWYIRFYIDNATEYEEFNLFELTGDDFRKLYLFLSRDSIFNQIPSYPPHYF